VNLGPDIAFPSGDFDKSQNMGVGGSAQLAIPFAFRFFITGHLSWVSYFESGDISQAKLGPGCARVRVRLAGAAHVATQAGATPRATDGNSETVFPYSAGVGIAKSNVDIGLRWDRTAFGGNVDVLARRFAYVFGMRLGAQ
jgi:hypothetical protein